MSGNALHYGDSLRVLRTLATASVDLVYLDPPFNSDARYAFLRDVDPAAAGAEAFSDQWRWNDDAEEAFAAAQAAGDDRAGATLAGLRTALGTSARLAYLAAMAARLVELRRVLKPTGSLWRASSVQPA